MSRAEHARRIVDLPELMAELSDAERELIEKLFRIQREPGYLRAPESMHAWIAEHFGSVEAAEMQRIVRIDNRWTLETTLFNELRARRPISAAHHPPPPPAKSDPFADPERHTPEDRFGRIRGRHTLTAGNVAKYDAQHAVIIFDEPNPLEIEAAALADAFDVARRWYTQVQALDPEARFPMLIWNSHARAGASIAHAHLQVTLARQAPYGGVERLRKANEDFRAIHGDDYFSALYSAHQVLGLGWEHVGGPVRVLCSLTPVKEKELLFIAPALDDELAHALHAALRVLIDELGVQAFNLGVLQPPLMGEQTGWDGFPVVARLVDRGGPSNPTNDIAALELYAASVVASDPFALAERLRPSL